MLVMAAVQKQSKNNLFFFPFACSKGFGASASADEMITWIFFCFLFNK